MAQHRNTAALVLDFAVNSGLTIIEVVTGLASGSTALLADSIQNLTDSIVLGVAYLSERTASRPGLRKKAVASIYRRAGIINASILIFLALFIGAAAGWRIIHPHLINGELVIVIGILSITINWVAAGILHMHRSDKSVRAPYIGLIFSGLSGVGVFAAGVASQFFAYNRLDGVIGIIIAVTLLVRSSRLLVLTLHDR